MFLSNVVMFSPPMTMHRSSHPDALNRPTIVFTHFWGGNEKNLARHVSLVNELGFTCVTFNFPDGFGLHRLWKESTSEVLDSVTCPKIVFAFSGPGAAVVDAVITRVAEGKRDILGMIFDSGPFRDLYTCVDNLQHYVKKTERRWIREPLVRLKMLSWGIASHRKLRQNLHILAEALPDFPILSIRGARDIVVPPEQIEAAFSDIPFRNFQTAILNAGHLTALKECPTEYLQIVENFLVKFKM